MIRLETVPSQAEGPGPEPARSEAVPGGLTAALGMIPPHGQLLLAIVSIQVGSALATKLFAALTPEGTVFWRVAFSAVLMLLVWRPRLRGITAPNALLLLAYGGMIAVMNLCFYQAIARIPLGIAVTIEFLGPLAVAALTSRRRSDFLWIALALLGVGLLTPDLGQRLDPVGLLYAAGAGVAWGSFVLLSIRVGKRFEKGNGLALGMTMAALLLVPFGTHTGGALLGDPLLLVAALAVALLSTTIPLTLEFEALKRLPPRVYGVLITLEPVAAVIAGALLLSEWPGPWGLVAVALVTTAAIGMTLTTRDGS